MTIVRDYDFHPPDDLRLFDQAIREGWLSDRGLGRPARNYRRRRAARAGRRDGGAWRSQLDQRAGHEAGGGAAACW